MDPKCLMHLVGLVVYISVIHGVFAIYHDIPDQVLVYLQAQMFKSFGSSLFYVSINIVGYLSKYRYV